MKTSVHSCRKLPDNQETRLSVQGQPVLMLYLAGKRKIRCARIFGEDEADRAREVELLNSTLRVAGEMLNGFVIR